MTLRIDHDRFDPVGPSAAQMNDPNQYDYQPVQMDADGLPFIFNEGDLGKLVWGPITNIKNARTGEQMYGPQRVSVRGLPVIYNGGRSANGSPTKGK